MLIFHRGLVSCLMDFMERGQVPLFLCKLLVIEVQLQVAWSILIHLSFYDGLNIVAGYYSRENVGLLGLTRVGSRRVVQISAGFMIFFATLGWY